MDMFYKSEQKNSSMRKTVNIYAYFESANPQVCNFIARPRQ